MAEINFEYKSFKVAVKWVKNIYIIAATFCFSGGISLLGGSVWLIVVNYYLQNQNSAQQSEQQSINSQWIGVIIGLACLLVAYFFLTRFLKEKRSIFYIELYNHVRLSVEKLGKLISLHYVAFDSDKFEDQRQEALLICTHADQYLKSHRLVIEDGLYKTAQKVLNECIEEIGFFAGYIVNNYKYQNNIGNIRNEYDPRDNHRENVEGYNGVKEEFEGLVLILKNHVSFNVHQV